MDILKPHADVLYRVQFGFGGRRDEIVGSGTPADLTVQVIVECVALG